MSDRPQQTPLSIGFLTVVQEINGYLGGYLLTNAWGRPLEFRLTTAVQPNRVQQILYGATLDEYLHADLIGKTLIEKTSAMPHLIVTDTTSMMSVRNRVEVPVICIKVGQKNDNGSFEFNHAKASLPLLLPSKFQVDHAYVTQLLDQFDQAIDLTEPFTRVREAILEARKTGVSNRAA